MNQTKTSQILGTVAKVLWRILLTLAVIGSLSILAIALILATVFNGPSATARNQLTLTLMESEKTYRIPGYFLSTETLDSICGNIFSVDGTCDPDLIRPQPENRVDTASHTANDYTAEVTVLSDSTSLRLETETADAGSGDTVICSSDFRNGTHRAGITADGILLIAENPDCDTSVVCGPVLILNGNINETLYGCDSGHAPRAAIGQTADGAVIFITTDGWTREHGGATYSDIIDLMLHYGAVNACLLDRDTVCTLPQQTAEREG